MPQVGVGFPRLLSILGFPSSPKAGVLWTISQKNTAQQRFFGRLSGSQLRLLRLFSISMKLVLFLKSTCNLTIMFKTLAHPQSQKPELSIYHDPNQFEVPHSQKRRPVSRNSTNFCRVFFPKRLSCGCCKSSTLLTSKGKLRRRPHGDEGKRAGLPNGPAFAKSFGFCDHIEFESIGDFLSCVLNRSTQTAQPSPHGYTQNEDSLEWKVFSFFSAQKVESLTARRLAVVR